MLDQIVLLLLFVLLLAGTRARMRAKLKDMSAREETMPDTAAEA